MQRKDELLRYLNQYNITYCENDMRIIVNKSNNAGFDVVAAYSRYMTTVKWGQLPFYFADNTKSIVCFLYALSNCGRLRTWEYSNKVYAIVAETKRAGLWRTEKGREKWWSYYYWRYSKERCYKNQYLIKNENGFTFNKKDNIQPTNTISNLIIKTLLFYLEEQALAIDSTFKVSRKYFMDNNIDPEPYINHFTMCGLYGDRELIENPDIAMRDV